MIGTTDVVPLWLYYWLGCWQMADAGWQIADSIAVCSSSALCTHMTTLIFQVCRTFWYCILHNNTSKYFLRGPK